MDHGPFTPAEGAVREASPPELFKLQVHRGDIIAEKVIGAGEFGEVYLANQKARSKTGAKIKMKRAVKTLKGIADEQSKKMFMRECLIMVAIGNNRNICRMIGVAVQQAPWLCVLEFVR